MERQWVVNLGLNPLLGEKLALKVIGHLVLKAFDRAAEDEPLESKASSMAIRTSSRILTYWADKSTIGIL
jgi:hypothetical protein